MTKTRRINDNLELITIYRREKNIAVYPHQGYEFGDQFDVLIDVLKDT